MARVLLIANPAASGFTGGLHRDVVRILREAHDVDAVWPTSPGQVEELTDDAADAAFDMVVAFGGDGIAHHVACRLRNTAIPMGIVPAGTTNVLARILGVPSKAKAAARYLAAHMDTHVVSTARLEGRGKGIELDTCATFAAGLGWDADVVAIAEQEPYRKYRFGAMHYARTAGAVLLKDYRGRPAMLRVSAGSRVSFGVTVLVQVHRPYTFFGRVPLALDGTQSEGLSILVIEDLALLRVPRILTKAVRGSDLGRIKGLTVWTDLESVTIEAEPAVSLQADGELIGLMSELTLTHEPGVLTVAAPGRE
ncbi:MAG: diacylglycerol/lipid kinase family protein [Acidimicrobiia bacterium]